MPFKRKTPYDSGVPDLWAIILSSVLPNLMLMHRDKFTDMLLTDPKTKKMLFEKLIQNRVYTHRVLGQQDKIQVVRQQFARFNSVRCYELQHLPECVNHVLRFIFLHQDKFGTFCPWFEPVQEDYTLKQSEDGALEVYLSPLSLSWAYEGALTEALRERASPPPTRPRAHRLRRRRVGAVARGGRRGVAVSGAPDAPQEFLGRLWHWRLSRRDLHRRVRGGQVF